MPKIPQEVAEGIASGEINTEAPSYTVIDGYVLAQFVAVSETAVNEESGYAQMEIEYEVVVGEYDGEKIRDWISYHPKAGWKFAQILEATEYTADTDFDELVDAGEQVVLLCEPQIINKGKNKGKMKTNIAEVLAPTAENLELAGVEYEASE